MPNTDFSNALEYSRRLYERVIDWYKNADSKAQIILSLDGAFLTFLTTSILKPPDELSKLISGFNNFTWFFLALMCICLMGSMISALMCLWSRISFTVGRDTAILEQMKAIQEAERYSPNVMLFFKTIAFLDHDKFQSQAALIDPKFEIKALASQIYLLSKRVYAKHLLINSGFVLAGAALIFFLLGGISYLLGFRK